MKYTSYSWEELLKLRPILEDNKVLIKRNGTTYEARMGINDKWYLHEVKTNE